MGSLISKGKQEEVETPGKESIIKRIEDPRSPTEEISRTPIEVTDKVPKESLRQLIFANALRQQNQSNYESSPCFPKKENCEKEMRKTKYPFSSALDSKPILYAEDSNISLDVSSIEKENVN